jgi:hypothetical protein
MTYGTITFLHILRLPVRPLTYFFLAFFIDYGRSSVKILANSKVSKLSFRTNEHLKRSVKISFKRLSIVNRVTRLGDFSPIRLLFVGSLKKLPQKFITFSPK